MHAATVGGEQDWQCTGPSFSRAIDRRRSHRLGPAGSSPEAADHCRGVGPDATVIPPDFNAPRRRVSAQPADAARNIPTTSDGQTGSMDYEGRIRDASPTSHSASRPFPSTSTPGARSVRDDIETALVEAWRAERRPCGRRWAAGRRLRPDRLGTADVGWAVHGDVRRRRRQSPRPGREHAAVAMTGRSTSDPRWHALGRHGRGRRGVPTVPRLARAAFCTESSLPPLRAQLAVLAQVADSLFDADPADARMICRLDAASMRVPAPPAVRMWPQRLSDVVGQTHLLKPVRCCSASSRIRRCIGVSLRPAGHRQDDDGLLISPGDRCSVRGTVGTDRG